MALTDNVRIHHFALPAAVVAVLIVVLGLALTQEPSEQNVSVTVDGISRWCLPNAITPKQQTDGLRGSTQSGMVFTFAKPVAEPFWNQGVSRQIFIVWVRGGEVIGTGVLLPFDSTYLYPPRAVDRVIELTPGMWSQGSTITFGSSCS